MPHATLALALTALVFSGCARTPVSRVEWPVMGTVAALQTRAASDGDLKRIRIAAQETFATVERLLNAHDPKSELSRLAPLAEAEVLAQCSPEVLPCYRGAFRLSQATGGAFSPRWKGAATLDLGAIAKGFAVDLAYDRLTNGPSAGAPALLDLGGNLRALSGDWKAGVRDPDGTGVAATVTLRAGEALATSATYYRGSHISDGRTGRPVTNDVASVTVLCRSAMWADGLSTTLFVLGPDKGRAFLDACGSRFCADAPASVLWILKDGRRILYGPDRFH